MSDVSDWAIVRTALADYAAVDAAGKLNIIGSNITEMSFENGHTGAFTFVLSVAVPPHLHGSHAEVEVVLEDLYGRRVDIPGEDSIVDIMTFEQPGSEDLSTPGTRRSRVNWTIPYRDGVRIPPGETDVAAEGIVRLAVKGLMASLANS